MSPLVSVFVMCMWQCQYETKIPFFFYIEIVNFQPKQASGTRGTHGGAHQRGRAQLATSASSPFP